MSVKPKIFNLYHLNSISIFMIDFWFNRDQKWTMFSIAILLENEYSISLIYTKNYYD